MELAPLSYEASGSAAVLALLEERKTDSERKALEASGDTVSISDEARELHDLIRLQQAGESNDKAEEKFGGRGERMAVTA